MDFENRLAALRKTRAMTQQALADQVGCHVTMIRRYKANETQPTLEVMRKLAPALSVSQLPPDEQSVVKEVLESLIIKYQTRRWDSSRTSAAAKKPAVTKRAHAAANR